MFQQPDRGSERTVPRGYRCARFTRYTAAMKHRCRAILRAILAAAALLAASGAIAGGVGLAYRVPLAFGIYDPWLTCTPPYGCYDAAQLRIELERDRRLQELRALAARSEARAHGPGDGPWGRQRYLPSPTPDANIQPAYRGTGQVRPEYEHSSQVRKPAAESPQ